jgi:hypothetical protein
MQRSSSLHVLDENTVLALRVDHSDSGAAGARPRGLVDQLESMAGSFGEGRRDVIHSQREVMQTLATASYEAADIRLGVERFEQLDSSRSYTEEGYANIRKTLIALEVEAQAVLEVPAG